MITPPCQLLGCFLNQHIYLLCGHRGPEIEPRGLHADPSIGLACQQILDGLLNLSWCGRTAQHAYLIPFAVQ